MLSLAFNQFSNPDTSGVLNVTTAGSGCTTPTISGSINNTSSSLTTFGSISSSNDAVIAGITITSTSGGIRTPATSEERYTASWLYNE